MAKKMEVNAKWAVRNDSTQGFIGQKYTLFDANYKRLGITEDHSAVANILIDIADLQALMTGFTTEAELQARMGNMESGMMNGTGALWVDFATGEYDYTRQSNTRRAGKKVSYR